MAFSPLEIDKQTVKKYGITEAEELSPVQKLAFLQDQLEQIQTMHWRSRVDILHAERLKEDKNEVLKNKGLANLSQHQNEVQQSVGAIRMLRQMINELREEYPELKVEE